MSSSIDLKQIYKSYRTPFIKWLTSRFSITIEDAEDIYQNAVVILYDKAMTGKLEDLRCSIKTYLFAIGNNLAHDVIRAKHKYAAGTSDLLLNYIVHDSDTEDKEQFEEDLRVAIAAIDTLGEPCKSILQYFYFEKLSLEEISRLMNYKNAESVKVQKCKCLKRLRVLMNKGHRKVKTSMVVDLSAGYELPVASRRLRTADGRM